MLPIQQARVIKPMKEFGHFDGKSRNSVFLPSYLNVSEQLLESIRSKESMEQDAFAH